MPQFWQKRFYDFNVWSRKKKVEKLEYMHMNPASEGWWRIHETGRGAAVRSISAEERY